MSLLGLARGLILHSPDDGSIYVVFLCGHGKRSWQFRSSCLAQVLGAVSCLAALPTGGL